MVLPYNYFTHLTLHYYNTSADNFYLKPIAACQTKAKSKKKTGITGNISTNGLKIAYASGSLDKNTTVNIINPP